VKPVKLEDTLCEKAAQRLLKGYNCAQSVLLTMFEHWNGENDLIPKIATAFGGGIGLGGSLCGALTGGVMSIGIRYGSNKPVLEERLRALQLARKFYRRFEKENGSVFCREIIGYDLSIPEELEKAWRSGIFEEKCVVVVRKAVESLLEICE